MPIHIREGNLERAELPFGLSNPCVLSSTAKLLYLLTTLSCRDGKRDDDGKSLAGGWNRENFPEVSSLDCYSVIS